MEQTIMNTKTQNTKAETSTAKTAVSITFGVIESLLALRLLFKLFGASTGVGFVRDIYGLTNFIAAAFEGILSKSGSPASQAIAALTAMLVIALIAAIVLKMIRPKTDISAATAGHTESSEADE